MGYFNEFPHTKSYDGDLGWLIKMYKELIARYKSNNEYLNEINQKIEDMTEEQLKEWLEDGTLENIISNLLKTFLCHSTTTEMLTDSTLIVGNNVITLGYDSINDRGGAMFQIVNKNTDDSNIYLQLENGLYAELIMHDYNPLTISGYSNVASSINTMLEKYNQCIIPNVPIDLDAPIEVKGNQILKCYGTINVKSSLDNAIIVHEAYNDVYIHHLNCNNLSNGLVLRNDSLKSDETCYHNKVSVDFIENSKYAIYLYTYGELNGIQYCEINNNYIKCADYGVYLLNATKGTWANENVFNLGKLEDVNYGIYLSNPTKTADRFNGNDFHNVGLEGINEIGIYLEHAWLNNFYDVRAMESLATGAKWIVLDSTANQNNFIINGAISATDITIDGARNNFSVILQDAETNYVTYQFYNIGAQKIYSNYKSTLSTNVAFPTVYNETKALSSVTARMETPLIRLGADSEQTTLLNIDQNVQVLYIYVLNNAGDCTVQFNNSTIISNNNLTSGSMFMLVYSPTDSKYLITKLERLTAA